MGNAETRIRPVLSRALKVLQINAPGAQPHECRFLHTVAGQARG